MEGNEQSKTTSGAMDGGKRGNEMQRWMAFLLFLVLLVIVGVVIWYVGSQKTIRAELLVALLPDGVSPW